MKYIAVTNARNEEKFIPKVIRAVMSQSIKPSVYVVSDDGSSDITGLLPPVFGAKIIRLDNERITPSDYNQAAAFNSGVKLATKIVPDWQYLLKLDADSLIPRTYVENLIKKSQSDKSLGILAGNTRRKTLSRVTDGARLISRRCYDAIGGYFPVVAFDTYAILLARQKGFKVKTFDDVSMRYRELRPSKKYTINSWIHRGMRRRELGFPLYHTVAASLKNGIYGSPPVLNSFFTIFAHALYFTATHDSRINKKWMKSYAIQEIKENIKGLLK